MQCGRKGTRKAVPDRQRRVTLHGARSRDHAVAARDAGASYSAKRAKPRRRGIDVGDVITRALTAAGLMK